MKSDIRRKYLAIIHIATSVAKVCSECGAIVFISSFCPVCSNRYLRKMTEFDYRRMLKNITGKTSCKDMDILELRKVVKKLYRWGYIPEIANEVKTGITKEKMIYKIYQEAKKSLGDNWLKRLKGFADKRLGKQIENCSINELRQIWGFLRKQEVSQ